MAEDVAKDLIEDLDSESDSEEESLGSVDNIILKGGRKRTTIQKEEGYVKKWNQFLISKETVIIKLRN